MKYNEGYTCNQSKFKNPNNKIFLNKKAQKVSQSCHVVYQQVKILLIMVVKVVYQGSTGGDNVTVRSNPNTTLKYYKQTAIQNQFEII